MDRGAWWPILSMGFRRAGHKCATNFHFHASCAPPPPCNSTTKAVSPQAAPDDQGLGLIARVPVDRRQGTTKWDLVGGRKTMSFAEGPGNLPRQPPAREEGLVVCGAPPNTIPQLCFNFFIVRLCLELLF